jgi:four helix bundle protein
LLADATRTLARYLRIALGSAGELEYYAILAGALTFLPEAAASDLVAQTTEVKKVLTGLLQAVTRTEN